MPGAQFGSFEMFLCGGCPFTMSISQTIFLNQNGFKFWASFCFQTSTTVLEDCKLNFSLFIFASCVGPSGTSTSDALDVAGHVEVRWLQYLLHSRDSPVRMWKCDPQETFRLFYKFIFTSQLICQEMLPQVVPKIHLQLGPSFPWEIFGKSQGVPRHIFPGNLPQLIRKWLGVIATFFFFTPRNTSTSTLYTYFYDSTWCKLVLAPKAANSTPTKRPGSWISQ